MFEPKSLHSRNFHVGHLILIHEIRYVELQLIDSNVHLFMYLNEGIWSHVIDMISHSRIKPSCWAKKAGSFR